MYRLISLAVIIVCIAMFVPSRLYAHDDGRFTNSPLKEWSTALRAGTDLCCAFADGVSVQDVDWDSQEGHYRVRIYGQWFVVPDAAVVTEPNRFGPAVVWPITTVTATPKFAALCLALARSPHLSAAIWANV
jgi:hypothetical protein